MSDITLPGTGAVVATDLVGGRQFQLVKLALGAAGASGAPVSATNPVPVADPPLKRIIDEASSTVTYLCEAQPGTASSAAAWRVQRISVAGVVTTISYAGTGAFDQVADNRAALSY